VLEAIWEPQFCECSYGYRRGRNAHDALKRLDTIIHKHGTQFVVEADIQSFFTTISHGWMRKFLEHRIKDPNFLRLVQRLLKTGVLEDGLVTASERGTPQGGLVSPILSNIYLHYALDLWFEKRLRQSCRGTAYLIRYCDDFVACFGYEEDARRFLAKVRARLEQFELGIEPTKTKLLAFGLQPGGEKSAVFQFLGFTHYITRSRRGFLKVTRRTDGKRLRRKLVEVKQRLQILRVQGGRAMTGYAQRHLLGHYQYYGVSDNSRPLRTYYRHISALLFKWLNRRSQRGSLTWKRFSTLLTNGLLPQPRIVHRFYS